jgi:hypothetical protein
LQEVWSATAFTKSLRPGFFDTQNEAHFYPAVLNSKTQWVANNQARLNIQAGSGLGGIVACVVPATRDKEAILVTHSNMSLDNTRFRLRSQRPQPATTDGDETWNKFISLYPSPGS